MSQFTLRISMTGLLLLAEDQGEVHVLFPRSGYDNGDHVEQHNPLISYDTAYLRPNSHATDGQSDSKALDGLVIDWTSLSTDAPNSAIPSVMYDLNQVTGQTFSRQIAVGDGGGNLVARVSLHHGRFTCYEHGNKVKVKNDSREASYFVQWTMHGIQGTQLDVHAQPLVGSGDRVLITLYPIHRRIDVTLWNVPAMPMTPLPGLGDSIPHFRAIYDLLRLSSTLPVPVLDSQKNPHGRCSHPVESHGRFKITNDAFQCFPGTATLT